MMSDDDVVHVGNVVRGLRRIFSYESSKSIISFNIINKIKELWQRI